MKSFEQIEYILEKYAGSSKVRDRVAASARDFLTTRKLSKLRQDKFLEADKLKSKPAQGGKSVKRGIQSVMDKTKSKVQNLKKKAGSEEGRGVGRSATGAFKSVFDFKPDTERTDTGQGGMGTALRNMTNIGKAAISGAINAPAETRDAKRKTIGGKILGRGKRVFQSKIGIKDKQKSPQGRKISTGQGDKIALDLENKTRNNESDAPTANQLAKNPGRGKTLRSLTGRMAIKRDQLKKERETRDKNMSDRPYIDKTGRRQKSSTSRNMSLGKQGVAIAKSSMRQYDKRIKNELKSERDETRLPRIRNTVQDSVKRGENIRKGENRLMAAVRNNKTSGGENASRVANQTVFKNPNAGQRNQLFRQQTLQNRKEFQNLKKTEPNKNPIQKRIPNLNNKNKVTTEETMNVKEANAILARRELAQEPNRGRARTFDQIQQQKLKDQALERAKKRGGSVMVTNNESYSHWREEFIWETDKKFPDKVKEIKPMSGKNNITINPEDETSKYKRGY